MNFLSRDFHEDVEAHFIDDSEDTGTFAPANDAPESKLVLSRPGVYALTVNPSDDFQYFTPPNKTHEVNQRFNNFKKHFQRLIDRIFEYLDVVLVVEISEPVTGKAKPGKARPRLHAHGLIHFKDVSDIRDFLLNTCIELTTSCSFSIKQIKDMSKWHAYCHKQQFLEWWPVVVPNRMVHIYDKSKKEKWDYLADMWIDPETMQDALASTDALASCSDAATRADRARQQSGKSKRKK